MSFFETKLPVSGKLVAWKPLSVGASFDVSAAHRSEAMRHLLGAAMLNARIISVDGKEGQMTMAEMRGLDEFDLEVLSEDVEQKEAARKATFRKERMGEDPAAVVDKAIEDAHVAAIRLSVALKSLLEARQLEAQSSGPLGSATT